MRLLFDGGTVGLVIEGRSQCGLYVERATCESRAGDGRVAQACRRRGWGVEGVKLPSSKYPSRVGAAFGFLTHVIPYLSMPSFYPMARQDWKRQMHKQSLCMESFLCHIHLMLPSDEASSSGRSLEETVGRSPLSKCANPKLHSCLDVVDLIRLLCKLSLIDEYHAHLPMALPAHLFRRTR